MIGEAWLVLAPPISLFGLLLQWSLGPVKMGREGGVLCLTEVRIFSDDWCYRWGMVSACPAHKPWWSPLVMFV